MIPKYLILVALACLLLVSCADEPQQQAVPDGDYQYVGSVNSDKYHYPSCRWAKKIKPENEIWFKDKEDARAHGYVPCKVCKP
jgi:micrococcal nuclease